MILGRKSKELLTVITKMNEDGSTLDTDEILQSISWKTTKPALLDILRGLISKGFVERCELEFRRDAHRRCYKTTDLGITIHEKT